MNERPPGNSWPDDSVGFEHDLDPALPKEELAELTVMAARLYESRPVPAPGLRSAVRSKLVSGQSSSRSRGVSLILGYASSGVVLLILAAAGLVGIGPFAA